MEIDLHNLADRMIIEVYGKETEEIFDINTTYTSKVYPISNEKTLKNVFFIINNIIKNKYSAHSFLTNEYTQKKFFKEALCMKEQVSLANYKDLERILKKVIPEVYIPFNYQDNEEDEYEKISYDTRECRYLDLENVHLYKVQNKIVYEYDGKDYKVLANLLS